MVFAHMIAGASNSSLRRSSAVLAIGAATLADIFDSHERGSKMGLYYSAPLLGPSIGPILGGG